MLPIGLVSVSLRELNADQIIAACLDAGLNGIEWGGDVHVPHGEIEMASEVGRKTRAAGLQVAAYGSYYRCDGDQTLQFSDVLASARALEAPLIRVWAGTVDAPDSTLGDFTRVIADLERISLMAGEISIATEFHGGTLTSTAQGAFEIGMNLVDFGVKTLWQPLQRGRNFDAKIEENLLDLEKVAPFLSNVHVYEWRDDPNGQTQRFSLKNSAQWREYIELLRAIEGERWLLLEFLPDDDVNLLAREAAALRKLLV